MAVNPKHILYPAIALGVLAMLTLSFLFDPVEHGWMPQCPLHELTGLYCTGCGAGRGLHALLHGEIAAAFRYNPLLVPAIFLLGLLVWKPGFAKKPGVAWGIVTVIILFTILRNIPAFGFLAPH